MREKVTLKANLQTMKPPLFKPFSDHACPLVRLKENDYVGVAYFFDFVEPIISVSAYTNGLARTTTAAGRSPFARTIWRLQLVTTDNPYGFLCFGRALPVTRGSDCTTERNF